MNDAEIKKYSSDDYEAVVTLMSSLQTHFANVDSMGELRTFQSREEANAYFDQGLKDVQEMQGATYVAKIGETVIGFIQGIITTHEGEVMHTLGHKKSKEGWIGLLFVNPDYRGRGTGKKLIDTIKEYFKEQHCETVRLLVHSDNSDAVKLYEKYGFTPKEIEMVLPL
ncbi:MAG: GNAT family N-acetyltransferase [Candidatus Woesebacteria bacterium]